jgi:hypothetical protein
MNQPYRRNPEEEEEQWQGGMEGLREMWNENKLLWYALGALGAALILMIIIRLFANIQAL